MIARTLARVGGGGSVSIVSADITDATSSATPNTVVKRDVGGGASFVSLFADGMTAGAFSGPGASAAAFPFGISANAIDLIIVPPRSGDISLVSGIITDATGARTLSADDYFQYVRYTNATANVITIPTNAVLAIPLGTEVYGRRSSAAGAVSLSFAGVTVNGSANAAFVPQDGNFALKKIDIDEWDFI